MSANNDISRVVRSWIREDEHDSADNILQVVLSRLDSTPQRRSWWPARRYASMNRPLQAAIAAAAVIAVAILGYNFLPRSGGSGGEPSAPPTVTSTLAPSIAPTSAPTSASCAAALPPSGPLAVGSRHCMILEGVPLSFSVQAPGWMSTSVDLIKGEYESPDGIGIVPWSSTPENVYADPCAHTPLSPPPSATAAGFAAAVATIPGTDLVSGPSSVSVGGRPAQHVVLTIRQDLDCDPHDAYRWYDESTGGASGGWRWFPELGSTIQVWIIDVDGTLVWIDAESFNNAGPGPAAEIQAFLDSIEFE